MSGQYFLVAFGMEFGEPTVQRNLGAVDGYYALWLRLPYGQAPGQSSFICVGNWSNVVSVTQPFVLSPLNIRLANSVGVILDMSSASDADSQ